MGGILELVVCAAGVVVAGGNGDERPRLRELGWGPGRFEPGPLNAITDVRGVRVGQVTVREEGICTGVTAILPHGDNLYANKVRAATFVGNGFGKLVGTTQVAELGTLETPILLTGTLSTFRVADHLVGWMLDQPGNEELRSINPVVGETNDGWLSDIRRRPITAEHVKKALESAETGPVEEGCVGAGTGTRCLGYKGGVGTASRRVVLEKKSVMIIPPVGPGSDRFQVPWHGHTVGVIVQTNFGGTLTVGGVVVGPGLLDESTASHPPVDRDGSCMIVVATDAPLDARQLARLSRRAIYAMARVGASYSHGSGDYAISFSTPKEGADGPLPDRLLSPLFEATLECVEEAILNSMLRAQTTEGQQGRVSRAIDIDLLVARLRGGGLPVHPPGEGR